MKKNRHLKETIFITTIFTILLYGFSVLLITLIFNYFVNTIQTDTLSDSEANSITIKLLEIKSYSMMIIGLNALLLNYVIYNSFNKKQVSNIEDISDALVQLTKGDYSFRIDNESFSKPLDQISSDINNLATVQSNLKEKDKILISGLSHDLRTPLTTIIGYLHVLKDGNYRSEEELNKYIDILFNKANDLLYLSDNLKEVAQALDTRQEKKDIIEKSVLVNKIINPFIKELESNDICVQFNISDEDFDFHFNIVDFRRILLNVFSNVKKYAVKNKDVLINIIVDDSNLNLSIGNGTTDSTIRMIHKLKERFYRVDESRSNSDGIGIGLSVTDTLSKNNDTKFEITSDPEKNYIYFNFIIKRNSN